MTKPTRGAKVERPCETCGAPMQVREADVKRGWGRFCSKSCKAAGESVSKVTQLNPDWSASRPAPKPIVRPCDHGLALAVSNLETQLGTVEAYNRLCHAAAHLKQKVDSGNAKAGLEMYAVNPYPPGL